MFTASLGIFLLGLIVSAAGGFLGAGVGGNFAFALTGFAVLFAWGIVVTPVGSTLGIDPNIAFNYIAFGPFVGPHIAFAGGAAAAAYAAHKGYIPTGKDATSPLAGLGKPSVLMVGAAFGVIGYLLQIGVSQIPWFGGHTDSVAVAVLVSALIARLAFGTSAAGKASIINPERFRKEPKAEGGFMGKWDTTDDYKWLPYQQTPKQFSAIGIFFGLAGAGVSLMLAINFPMLAGSAHTFVFGISAIIILFLILGWDMPVQHHVTITAGLAAVLFFPIFAGGKGEGVGYYLTLTEMTNDLWFAAIGAVLVGGFFGWVGALLAEVFQRVWYARGTTHVDPPASSIWLNTTIIWLIAGIFGLAGAL